MTSQRVFLFSLIFSFSLIFLIFFRQAAFGSDFISYYTAASLLKDGNGAELYDIQKQAQYEGKIIDFKVTNILPYRYLPFVAGIMLPFAYLPFFTSFIIFSLLNIVILIKYILTSEKVFTEFRNPLFLSGIILLYLPNLQTILGGQISLLLSLLVLLIYLSLKDKRYYVTGLLAGLMLIKIQYIILIPFLFFLVKKKRPFLGGLFVSLGVIVIISLLLTGLEGLAKYPGFLLATERPEYSTWNWHSFTFYSFLRALPLVEQTNLPVLLVINAFFYLTGVVIFVKKVRHQPLEQSFSFAIIATVLFSVHALRQDLSLLMTPILILLNIACVLKGDKRRIILIQASVLYLLFFSFGLTRALLGEVNPGALFLIWVLWTGSRLKLNLNLKDSAKGSRK